MNINQVVSWFESTKSQKVRVNDVEYQNKVGIPTIGKWYKNGFEAKIIDGKQGKRKYLQIYIYTSAGNNVDVEEKFLFAKIDNKYKIVQHLGWHNVDLLRLCKRVGETTEWEKMLRAMYNNQ